MTTIRLRPLPVRNDSPESSPTLNTMSLRVFRAVFDAAEAADAAEAFDVADRKRRLRRVIPLVALVVAAGCGPLDRSTPAEHIAKARARLAVNDVRTAEIELKNALQKDPKNIQGRLLIADVYLAMNRGQDAEVELSHAEQFGASPQATLLPRARAYVLQRQYSRVLKDIPSNPTGEPAQVADLLEARGDAQAALGMGNEAEASYDAVLQMRSKSVDALFGKARVAASRGDLDGAMRLVDSGLAIAPKSTGGLLLKGDILYGQQKGDEAIKAYTTAVDSAPDSVAARIALGSAFIRNERFDAANEQIAAVLKRSPNNAEAYYLQAVMLYTQGKYKASFDAVQKVTAALPNYAPALILTASVQYQLGQYLQAETNAQHYLQTFPNAVHARKLLATIFLKERKPTEALAAVEPLLSLADLKDGQVYALAGAALGQLNNPTRAMEYLQKASSLNPDDSTLKTAYGLNSLAAGDVGRAVDTFESLVRVDTSNTDADSILVITYIGRKEYAKAIAAAEALIKANPKSAVFYNLAGGAYGASGDLKNARDRFEKAVALDPQLATAALNLARMDIVDKNVADARKRLTDVLARDAKNVDVLNALADIEISQNRLDEAARWLETAVKQNPALAGPKSRLIGFYLRNQDTQRAVALAREAETKSPGDVEVLLLLAQSLTQSGDRDAAVATYGRIAGLRPNDPRVQVEIARLEAADGHTGAARAALQKALVAAPDYTDAQIVLADLETGLGRFDDARRIAAKLDKTPATQAAAKVVLGNIAMGQRRYDQAAKSFADAFATTKTAFVVTRLHAALYAAGRKREADEAIGPWLAANKDDRIARLYLAGTLQLAGDVDRARDLYRQVVAIDPRNAQALNELALLSHAAKDPQAVDYAERAYALQPNSGAVGDTLGWILVDRGDVERGQHVLEKAVKAAPWNNEARYHLAVALAKAGDKAGARSNLKQLVESPDAFAQRADAKKLLDQL